MSGVFPTEYDTKILIHVKCFEPVAVTKYCEQYCKTSPKARHHHHHYYLYTITVLLDRVLPLSVAYHCPVRFRGILPTITG